MKSVMDPKLIRRQLYNRNKFDVAVECDPKFREYVLGAGITWAMPNGMHAQILKAESWCVVNHMYVTFTGIDKFGRAMPQGTPIDLTETFGNDIGKPFKNPSLPEMDLNWIRKGKF